jgi:transcriptional regulator with XRE-family HTH domain
MMDRMSYIVDTVELKKLLIEKNIDSIGAFAELSGVGRDTISGILKGTIRPSTAVMDKIIIALELDPAVAGHIFFKPNLRNT